MNKEKSHTFGSSNPIKLQEEIKLNVLDGQYKLKNHYGDLNDDCIDEILYVQNYEIFSDEGEET